MANLLRKEVKRRGKDTSRPAPSKRSPRKSTPLQPVLSEPEKPQESSSSPSQKGWLKRLLGIGK